MKQARIVVVEDEMIVARDLRQTLERLGYLVPATVTTGAEALNQAGAARPDLLLMDIHLAGDMDGVAAAQEIRARYSIPVVYLTAHSDITTMRRVQPTAPFGYVVKPFTEHELYVAIEVALQRAAIERELRDTQQALQQVHDALEQRVQERTAELAQANLALSAEIEERRRVAAELRQLNDELELRVAERTAELRVANAELARGARMKDEFLASMSHELRTPLNTVLGMAETLQEGVYGPLTEDQTDAIRSVEISGRHLLALINDILDLSKIEAGKLALELSPVELDEICQASIRLIKQSAEHKRLTISVRLDDRARTIQADARRLKQILVNLLSNAVKFTPEGGAIGLDVAADPAQHNICLSVWDTGIGIAQADLPRLFHPFVQLDSGLARQYTGTGLGLVLVARMVDLHGGSVAVASEPGQGSCFTVTLPWDGANGPDDQAGDAPPGHNTASLAGPATRGSQALSPNDPSRHADATPMILLVEDDEDNITLFSHYLRARSYRVAAARDGNEAIERAQALRPALILMDIQMPSMNGLEAIRRVRADAGLSETPIIALTALAMAGDAERCLAAGANTYLSKPIRLKDLVTAIETQLQRHM